MQNGYVNRAGNWVTDRHIINCMFFLAAAEFVYMPVKTFKLCKKVGIGKITVYNTNRIVGIKSCNKCVAGILNCFHVAWGYITSSADECKIFHQ